MSFFTTLCGLHLKNKYNFSSAAKKPELYFLNQPLKPLEDPGARDQNRNKRVYIALRQSESLIDSVNKTKFSI